MALRNTAGFTYDQTSRLLGTLIGWYRSPALRFSLFQGVVVVLVGLLLGAWVVVATSDSLAAMVLLLLIALGPFGLLIASSLTGGLRRTLLAVILLEIPIGFDFNPGHSEVPAEMNIVGGYNISVTLLCLIFLYVWWFADIATNRTQVSPWSLARTHKPLLAYTVVCFLSLLVAASIPFAAFEVFLLFQSLLLFLYVAYAVQTRNDMLFVLGCLMLGLVLQSLIIIALRFIGTTVELGPLSLGVMPGGRISGTLGHPNSAGSYLTLVLIATISVIVMPVKRRYRWFAALAFGLGSVALLLTQSRGAWVGFALGLGLFWLLAWRRGWFSLALPIIGIICAIPIAIYFREVILGRIFGDDGGAAEARLPLMLLALRMIRDHWLFGVGANNFAIHLREYLTPEMANEWITTVHNKYLLVWAETGIFGLATFLWFLLSTLRRGWQVWLLGDRFFSPIALGFTMAFVGWMVHMNFDLFHTRPQVQLLLLIGGLIAALHHMAQVRAPQWDPAPSPQAGIAGNGRTVVVRT